MHRAAAKWVWMQNQGDGTRIWVWFLEDRLQPSVLNRNEQVPGWVHINSVEAHQLSVALSCPVLSSSPGLSEESGTGASGIGVVTGAIATRGFVAADLLARAFEELFLVAFRGEAFFLAAFLAVGVRFLAAFLAVFFAVFLAVFFAAFLAVFFAGRRDEDFADFFIALRFFVVAILCFPFFTGLAQPNKILDVCLRTFY
jgi:hypothetical protein